MHDKDSVGGGNHGPAEAAARWFARLRSSDCTAAERREFETWVALPGNREAYSAVARTAARVSDALKHDPRLRALLTADDPFREAAAAKPSRSCGVANAGWRLYGIAAAWVLIVALAVLGIAPRFVAAPPAESFATYANTELRERSFTLEDGSVLHLDAGSEVLVTLAPDRRRLELRRGRAYFEVAHDASRPFTVDAGGTRTTALGTRFEVRLQPQGVTVTLAEGSVSVRPAAGTEDWKELLRPGQQLTVDVANPRGQRSEVDAARVTAWSTGRLHFDGTPLVQVLEEVNRYSGIKVLLGDERLAATPIGGSFVAGGDPGAFVQALSAILPVRSEPRGDQQILLFPRERSPAVH